MKPVEITEWIWTDKTKLEFECYIEDRFIIGTFGASYHSEDSIEVWINELDSEFYKYGHLLIDFAVDRMNSDLDIMDQLKIDYEDSLIDEAFESWRDNQ